MPRIFLSFDLSLSPNRFSYESKSNIMKKAKSRKRVLFREREGGGDRETAAGVFGWSCVASLLWGATSGRALRRLLRARHLARAIRGWQCVVIQQGARGLFSCSSTFSLGEQRVFLRFRPPHPGPLPEEREPCAPAH